MDQYVDGWRKSSLSGNSNNCVEVRQSADGFFIRDSKYLRDHANDPAAQPVICIPGEKWAEFLSSVTDRIARPDVPLIEYHQAGGTTLHANGIALTYTQAEWDAFIAGIRNNEFEPKAPVGAIAE